VKQAANDGPKNDDTLEVAEEENITPNKSPLLTAHRISVMSDMDDVSLEEGSHISTLEGPTTCHGIGTWI
jgi:hypothetical protein